MRSFLVLLITGLLGLSANGSSVVGSGSTFVFPLMSQWALDYAKIDKENRINYQSTGSGAGIRQMAQGTVRFAGTDAFVKDEDLKNNFAGRTILHIPVTMGAVVMAFNLPGVSEVKLTGPVIGKIFRRAITQWNHPDIVSLNPALKDNQTAITIVHRSDGSGTTAIFTDYLTKVDKDWKAGSGTSVAFPTGQGVQAGKGNEGVTAQVTRTVGSIGYIELLYATNNKIPFALVQNRKGEFVKPSSQSVSAAADEKQIPADYRASITNSPAAGAYPISGFVWVLIEKGSKAKEHAAIVNFLRWATKDGQSVAEKLGYAPLSPSLVTKIHNTLAQAL